MFKVISIFFLTCAYYVAFVVANPPPTLSLPGPYHFDGTGNGVVHLTNYICVKGNNARSITFQMKTTQQIHDFVALPPMIGKIFFWYLI